MTLPEVVVHPHELVQAPGHQSPSGTLGNHPRWEGSEGYHPMIVIRKGLCSRASERKIHRGGTNKRRVHTVSVYDDRVVSNTMDGLDGLAGSYEHYYKWRIDVFDDLYSCCCCCCFLTLTDPLRIQPWSQDRRNQTKSNRESEMSMESRQRKDGQEVASKGHRRDKIENINKKHTDSRNKLEPTA